MSLTGQWQFSDGSSKIVIDRSMTVSAVTMAETMVQPAPLESVIDWSMTVWVTNIARTYGHVSLTPVNDTKFMDICHWLQSMTEIYGQTCQKVSLTAVNDKKKCHWLDVYYIWEFLVVLGWSSRWAINYQNWFKTNWHNFFSTGVLNLVA